MLDEAFLKICLSLHRLSDVCIYYEHIKNFHFVKKAIDPVSLFELGVRRGGITFQVAHLVFPVIIFLFLCYSLYIFDTWLHLSTKSARPVKNSTVVFEGHLYHCNFLQLQTFPTLLVNICADKYMGKV